MVRRRFGRVPWLHRAPRCGNRDARPRSTRSLTGWDGSAAVTADCVSERVSPDLAAQHETGLVVQARVEARVDTAKSGFGRGGVEAAEGAGDTGQCWRGDGERDIAVEGGQDRGCSCAEGAVRAGVGRIRWSRCKGHPGRVADGQRVAVGVGELDSGDGPPKPVGVLGVVHLRSSSAKVRAVASVSSWWATATSSAMAFQ